jgi:hypothetical protein
MASNHIRATIELLNQAQNALDQARVSDPIEDETLYLVIATGLAIGQLAALLHHIERRHLRDGV